MCERRGCIDEPALHKFFDEGMIACQLLERSRPIEICAAISQVGDMGRWHWSGCDRQRNEGCAHALQGRFRENEVMDSPIGARHEISDKFSGSARMLAEPGLSFSCPLCGGGYGSLGCEIPCRMTSH